MQKYKKIDQKPGTPTDSDEYNDEAQELKKADTFELPPRQRKSLLQSIQEKKQQKIQTPENDIVKADVNMNLVAHTVRRGGLLHIGMQNLDGGAQQSYEQLLKKNIVDLAQIEDAETAITALRKITKKPEEIEYLKKAIQNLEIFKSDGNSKSNVDLSHVFESTYATNQLFKGLKHVVFKKRETLFNYGDYGNLYFVVLIGEVWTLIPKNPNEKELENGKKKKEHHHKILTDDEFLAKNFPGFINVKIFKPGQAFGEIALLTKSKRTATMVAKEDTHVMTLSKASFDQIIGTHKEQILQEKLNFLKNFPFFSEIPNSSLMSNILHYTNITIAKNKDQLYSEKDNVTSLYSGEVILNKQVKIQDEDYEKSKETISSYVVLSNKESQNLQQGQTKRINYAFLGPNTFFGEEEYFLKKTQRESKAICSSQIAEIYIINKDRVYDTVRKHGQQAIFREALEVKNLRHNAQLRKFMQTQGFSNLALIKARQLLNEKEISGDMINSNNNGKLDLSVKRTDILKFAKKKKNCWDLHGETQQVRERVNQHYHDRVTQQKSDYKLQFTSQTNKILQAEEIMHTKMKEKEQVQRVSHNKMEEIFNTRPELIYGFLNSPRKGYESSILSRQNENSIIDEEQSENSIRAQALKTYTDDEVLEERTLQMDSMGQTTYSKTQKPLTTISDMDYIYSKLKLDRALNLQAQTTAGNSPKQARKILFYSKFHDFTNQKPFMSEQQSTYREDISQTHRNFHSNNNSALKLPSFSQIYPLEISKGNQTTFFTENRAVHNMKNGRKLKMGQKKLKCLSNDFLLKNNIHYQPLFQVQKVSSND